MKTLNDHVILYDSECPMCKVYTHAFTSSGMLGAEGRAPYQDMPAFACPVVDPQRAVNEIALVNKITGEVSYGIDSLFKVIGHSFPVFKPLFAIKSFIWLMRKVYAFISYNRKVIIPAPVTNNHSLQPAFSFRYRIAYLIFTALIAGLILTTYAKRIGLAGDSYREYLICLGQLIFQGVIVKPRQRWEYLGNMMTISLAGSLLLLPAIATANLIPLPRMITIGYFLLVAGLMLLEHVRRTRLLSLGWELTASWVFYRLIVLWLIL